MKLTKIAVALAALILMQACEDPDRYPVSEQDCGPNDPVLDLTVPDCAPPA